MKKETPPATAKKNLRKKSQNESTEPTQNREGQRFTARELAEQYRVSVDTIQRHGVKLFGFGETGKTRRYTEVEATAILVSIQQGASNQYGTSAAAAEVETELSLYMEAAALERRSKDVWKRIAEQEKSRADTLNVKNQELAAAYGREVLDHKSTRNLLDERETGLEMLQRIAEAGGLITTDREDILSAYRSVR